MKPETHEVVLRKVYEQLSKEKEYFEELLKETYTTIDQVLEYRENAKIQHIRLKLSSVPDLEDRHRVRSLKDKRTNAIDNLNRLTNIVKDAVGEENIIESLKLEAEELRKGNGEKRQVLEIMLKWVNVLLDDVTKSGDGVEFEIPKVTMEPGVKYLTPISKKFETILHRHRKLQQSAAAETEKLQLQIKENEEKINTLQKELVEEYERTEREKNRYERCLRKLKCVSKWIDALTLKVERSATEITEYTIDHEIRGNAQKMKNIQLQFQDMDAAFTRLINIVQKRENLPSKSKQTKNKQEYILLLEQKLSASNDRLAHTEKEKEKAINEKEKILIRLSKIAGSKLRDNNPAIADLSDENRPTKLAEKFGELYDNEWTDALTYETEKLGYSEEEAIGRLLGILQGIYERCSAMGRTQLEMFRHALQHENSEENPTEADNIPEIPPIMMKRVKDFQKENVQEMLGIIEERIVCREPFEEKYKEEKEETQHCRPYISKCINLCWIMNIQDPTVVLLFENEKDKPVDTNVYRHYTRSGKTLDYMVWPALFLHKDGPLLQKGVVQPKRPTPEIGTKQ